MFVLLAALISIVVGVFIAYLLAAISSLRSLLLKQKIEKVESRIGTLIHDPTIWRKQYSTRALRHSRQERRRRCQQELKVLYAELRGLQSRLGNISAWGC